jgi:hypothetical protein
MAETKRKNNAGSKNHSPHQLREVSTWEPGAKQLLQQDEQQINEDNEGCMLDLKPAS